MRYALTYRLDESWASVDFFPLDDFNEWVKVSEIW